MQSTKKNNQPGHTGMCESTERKTNMKKLNGKYTKKVLVTLLAGAMLLASATAVSAAWGGSRRSYGSGSAYTTGGSSSAYTIGGNAPAMGGMTAYTAKTNALSYSDLTGGIVSSDELFSKRDLKQTAELDELVDIYQKIGYECVKASAEAGIGIDRIDELTRGKLSLLAGHSGVGKSTIANRLNPNLDLRTTAISDSHDSGMHTTTYPEMHPLLNSGYIIDSPGIKGFGTIEMKDEMAHYFPEMFAESANCQFYNCTHTHEPKCAVKQAVAEGRIAQSRYNSYLSLLNDEDEDKYRQGVD